MNKLASSALTLLAVSALFAGEASAQASRVSLEPRAGASFPLGTEGLKTGFVLGGDVLFQATPMLAVYAGYNHNQFGVDDSVLGEDEEIPEGVDVNASIHGFDAGLRATFAVGGFSPFLQGGVLFQKLSVEIEGDEGSFSGSSDTEIGFQVGGGVEFPLSPRLSLTPAVTFNQVEDTQYVRADVGLRIRL